MAETRIVLTHCTLIDPTDIATYTRRDGFAALTKARTLGPDGVIAQINASGLRGRGGAGFPCAAKWALARASSRTETSSGTETYLICNADEGEVGTFKDRYILEHDPFSLIEGIAIAAYAIGAKKAYIYLRGEYHYLHDRLRTAIDQATTHDFLPGLAITIQEGAGAYICGEESALMNSIEGKRGEARFRPPFPPTHGLFGKPTVINNVETLMNIPSIIARGPAWFAAIGTPESTGTKVFSVAGDVERPGVYELPMGTPLTHLLEFAGARDIKLVQVGGAGGRILPAALINTPLSFETVLGSGGITVCNATRDVIDVVYRCVEFLHEESCGLCTPCREGTEVMMEIMTRLTRGDGVPEDLTTLADLARTMMDASLCGLGQAAPIPVLDTLTHFRHDYETRIAQSVYLRALR